MNPRGKQQIEQTANLMSQGKRLLAYGGLDGVIQRPLLDGNGRLFPHFAESAEGCRLVDSTGRSIIDWVNGWGPVLLGYQNPDVQNAIARQLELGPTMSLMNPIEIRVAELIENMVPCAEMIAFGKNGSDAVTAALRVARAVTGREIILQFGFHGFHDWYTCLHPQVEGITPILRDYVESFEYNDLGGLSALFEQHQGKVAAVIMEPVNMWLPDEGYLEQVKEMAHQNGALLIFDEMVTAFRLARGGAQERYGVVPDLACLGKGMANGMPLSAVVGKRIYMQRLPGCGFGMTFRGETLSLAAAEATLTFLCNHDVCERLEQTGEAVRSGFHQLCKKHQVECQLSGPGSRMTFVFHDQAGMSWQNARDFFLQECLLEGVLTNGNLLPSYAHEQSDIDETLKTFDTVLEKLAQRHRAIDDDILPIGGFQSDIQAIIANGFVESLEEENGFLQVTGWLMLNAGSVDSIELCSDSSPSVVVAEKINRPDLVSAFPDRPEAEWAGFFARVPKDKFATDEHFSFTIAAQQGQQTQFQCLVKYRVPSHASGPWSIADGVLYL